MANIDITGLVLDKRLRAFNIKDGTYHNVLGIDFVDGTIMVDVDGVGVSFSIDGFRLSLCPDESLSSKESVSPSLFWIIPFVGWFMVVYHLTGLLIRLLCY